MRADSAAYQDRMTRIPALIVVAMLLVTLGGCEKPEPTAKDVIAAEEASTSERLPS